MLAWGNEVLVTNAHRRAIVVTHNFGNTTTPVVWSAQAQAIYDALKGNTNLFMFLGGHVTGQGKREDTYEGRIVRTFVQDYQGWTNGGNGFMRTFDFSPSNNVVIAQCFSPVTGEYLTDENSEFFFPYDLQPTGPGTATPFVALATNLAAPGDLSACFWPGLQPDKAYEWYVAVTDQSGVTVTSPVWRFTTATSNTPPSVVNLIRTLTGDAPTNLVLLASDANGDALTFQIHTLPTQGLLEEFNPNTGAFTYSPAYGYRGTDRFTFSANDGQANSSVASMNLNIVSPARHQLQRSAGWLGSGLWPQRPGGRRGWRRPEQPAGVPGQHEPHQRRVRASDQRLPAADQWKRQPRLADDRWHALPGPVPKRDHQQRRRGRVHGPGPAADQRAGPQSLWRPIRAGVHRRLHAHRRLADQPFPLLPDQSGSMKYAVSGARAGGAGAVRFRSRPWRRCSPRGLSAATEVAGWKHAARFELHLNLN